MKAYSTTATSISDEEKSMSRAASVAGSYHASSG
jgi:hypothetical protein